MAARDVHWHEGMFLRTQHFQASHSNVMAQMALGQSWDTHYNWGLRSIDIDPDALGNFRLVISRLRARLRDGTLVDTADTPLPELDLKPALDEESVVTVLLAVPQMREGYANVGSADDGHARYVVETVDLVDENTGSSPQLVHVRRLNVRLLLSTQDAAGYATLPLVKIEKSDRAEGLPQLHAPPRSSPMFPYIPPLLACDAWEPLAVGVLRSVYDRIGQKLTVLAALVTSRGISFGSQSAQDALILDQMCTLNEAYALLGVLVFAEGLHPLPAYLELCRLVGRLAIYARADRRTPDLPRYDHDNLAGCFYPVKNYIDALLDEIIEPDYKEAPFIGSGLRMEVSLDSEWLNATNQMFVGVRSALTPEECVRWLKPGGLDMKIASASRVDPIYKAGKPGLAFTFCPTPPLALPRGTDLAYFQINRDAQAAEWQHVQTELNLSIRLNERLIVGKIADSKTFTVRTGAQTTPMQFTLFVTRGDA